MNHPHALLPRRLRRATSASSAIIPSSPPPLSQSRRASLTFSPSALERFRLPDPQPPPPLMIVSTTVTAISPTAADISPPPQEQQQPPSSSLPVVFHLRRSSRLRQQQQQPKPQPRTSSSSKKKKATAAHSSSSTSSPPRAKKARITTRTDDDDNEDDRKPAPSEQHCCTICMSSIATNELASVDGCSHMFCFDCIQEWSDQENSCPNCKVRFSTITNVADGTTLQVVPRNQYSDSLLLETMLGQLAATAHYSWATAAATTAPRRPHAGVAIGIHAGGGGGAVAVPDTLHSLRLALTIQARTAAMRVIHTQQHSVRLQSWLARHTNPHLPPPPPAYYHTAPTTAMGRSYHNPIEIMDNDTAAASEVQLVE